jgi:NTE family protein
MAAGRMTGVGQRRHAPRIGLALAGGDPVGGIYEVGALLALADSLDGIELTDLDVYVGVSSGSFVAAGLANGISPAQMYRLFIDDGDHALMTPDVFLRPAFGEFGHRALALPGLAARAIMHYLRDPFHHGITQSLATLSRSTPAGIFDNAAIDAFLSRLFSAPGRANDFRELRHKLFLVATNLDSGASVAFGGSGHDRVPISKAFLASSALPGLFPPVEIANEYYVDGALNKTLNASAALDEGVDLLLCINPLVPFDASKATLDGRVSVEKLNRGGLPLVLSQTFRAIIHSRMKVGMEKYRHQYPHADIVLFKPDREDSDMFFANLFSYAQRKHLCAAAYLKTRENLVARAAQLLPMLAKRGIEMRRDRLDDRSRAVTEAVSDPRPLRSNAKSGRGRDVRQTTRDLDHTLDQLQRWLAGAH